MMRRPKQAQRAAIARAVERKEWREHSERASLMAALEIRRAATHYREYCTARGFHAPVSGLPPLLSLVRTEFVYYCADCGAPILDSQRG